MRLARGAAVQLALLSALGAVDAAPQNFQAVVQDLTEPDIDTEGMYASEYEADSDFY